MLIGEREMSSKMIVLESLLRRLDDDFEYEYWKSLYNRLKFGYEGELRVDREWQEMIIPSNYYLYHNFETENEWGNSHQIDSLFICRHFILLLEIKNIGGQIEFDQVKHQFIRTRSDGTKESFSNPIDQIERHERFFRHNLVKWDISIPIEYAIVLAQPSTIIGVTPKNVSIFHLSGLQTRVQNLFKKYPQSRITQEQLEMLNVNLLAIQKRIIWKPNIDRSKLRKGVLCKECKYNSVMEFKYGRFVCPVCNLKSKDALYEALHDYRLIYKPWITNREFKIFFNVSSSNTVNKMLKRLGFEYEGVNRGRIYFIPEDILKKSYLSG